jgi:putative intracellular protease/amidase
MSAKKVLLVLTSFDEMQEGKKTGVWLSEFAEPYEVFQAAGFAVTVASIKGGRAPIDPNSVDAEAETKWKDLVRVLEDTVSIHDVNAADYDAILLPGGHGTMFDFSADQQLQALIREFAETDRVVAAVCHGPAGLVDVKLSNGEHFVKGKTLTGFTDEEEHAAQMVALMPFLLETRLRQAGAAFVAAPAWSNHVEVDGNLVTGQNPQSGESAARKVVELLAAK